MGMCCATDARRQINEQSPEMDLRVKDVSQDVHGYDATFF
jgi:hypothetical protein